MRQLAVRPIDRPPPLDQVQDRGLLTRQQPVHRVATRRAVDQRGVCDQPGAPAVHPHIGDAQHRAGAGMGPAGIHGVIDQLEQLLLGMAVHTRWHRAQTQPKRDFPRTSVSSTANSVSASDNLAFSARSAAISTSNGERGRPGLDAANAASAAWRASGGS